MASGIILANKSAKVPDTVWCYVMKRLSIKDRCLKRVKGQHHANHSKKMTLCVFLQTVETLKRSVSTIF